MPRFPAARPSCHPSAISQLKSSGRYFLHVFRRAAAQPCAATKPLFSLHEFLVTGEMLRWPCLAFGPRFTFQFHDLNLC
jgi:hypothetical protein